MSKNCNCNKHHEHDHNECCEHEHEHGHSHEHGHGHEHEHEESGNIVIRLVIAAILWLVSVLAIKNETVKLVLQVIAYLVAGYDVVLGSLEGLRHLELTDERFLMTLASVTAFFIGEGMEGVMIMILYQLGEFLNDKAVDHSRDSISALLSSHTETVNVLENGQVKEMDIEEVRPGMLLQIRPFEEIPVDGIVREGSSALDLSSINGESMPVAVQEKDEVISGSVNQDSLLVIEATRSLADSAKTKIAEMVAECEMEKSETEGIVEKFTRYYTPTVIILAVILAVFMPLVFKGVSYRDSIKTACTLLVVSCPCALVISIPLAFFCGMGQSSRQGVLVKGAQYLESLAGFNTLAMDKTGTITTGEFVLSEITTNKNRDELLKIAQALEANSNHPLARALGQSQEAGKVHGFREVMGRGVEGEYEGHQYVLGSASFLKEKNIAGFEKVPATAIYMACDGEYVGTFIFHDDIKPETSGVIGELKKMGVSKVAVLSGDHQYQAEELKNSLPLDEVHGELMPADKVELVRSMKQQGAKTVFIGDGSNDAAVLAMADIGIAMGLKGTDMAIKSADVVLMHDNLKGLVAGRKTARETLNVVKQNLIFIIACKLLFIILGIFNLIPMWLAVFADVGVTLICVLNAIRLFKNHQ